MQKELKQKIRALAKKYETADFLKNDPSQFMHRFTDTANQELAAFIASSLAFGRREQILSHVEFILSKAGCDLRSWILKSGYKKIFDSSQKSFYRMYSNNAMLIFFDTLHDILKTNKTLGEYFCGLYLNKKNGTHLCHIIAQSFPKECTLIPFTKTSACKKINMFLRWMVRTSSPVDLGIWTWYDAKNLLIPLDTHVLQTAVKFNLLPHTSTQKIPGATFNAAKNLTDKMQEVFPDDPVRADYALFGLGAIG